MVCFHINTILFLLLYCICYYNCSVISKMVLSSNGFCFLLFNVALTIICFCDSHVQFNIFLNFIDTSIENSYDSVNHFWQGGHNNINHFNRSAWGIFLCSGIFFTLTFTRYLHLDCTLQLPWWDIFGYYILRLLWMVLFSFCYFKIR